MTLSLSVAKGRRRGKKRAKLVDLAKLESQWIPRWPPMTRDDDEFEKEERTAKAMVYWSRWVDSHEDIETSHLASKLTRWVAAQRRSGELAEQCELLRRVAADHIRGDGAKLCVRRNQLLSFFLREAIGEETGLRAELMDGSLTALEYCRLLHSIGVVAHHLFGHQPLTERVIQSLVRLLAAHAHRTLDVPTRMDLRSHLLQAARGEPALHAVKPYYRDHFFHVLEVCFLGNLLLETQLGDEERLWELTARRLGCSGDRKRVLRLWYIAALMHDLGYGMDLLKGVRRMFKFFEHAPALQQFTRQLDGAVDHLSRHEDVTTFGFHLKDRPGEDHGVVGALHVKGLLDRIALDDPSVRPDDFKPAIRAIAKHNNPNHPKQVAFRDAPLAFLLILCDQLQEWKRPRLHHATAPYWLLARLSGAAVEDPELTGPFENMTTNVNIGVDDLDLSIPRLATDSLRPTLQFTVEYGVTLNRNSQVFNLWLDASTKFQHLDLQGLPLDIDVTYVTPRYWVASRQLRESQLDRLRDAAHDTHMAFLANWFPAKKRDGTLINEAVTHSLRDGDESTAELEALALRLRELSRKRPITRNIEVFRNRLKEWKRYNEDRDFPGDYAPVVPE